MIYTVCYHGAATHCLPTALWPSSIKQLFPPQATGLLPRKGEGAFEGRDSVSQGMDGFGCYQFFGASNLNVKVKKWQVPCNSMAFIIFLLPFHPNL